MTSFGTEPGTQGMCVCHKPPQFEGYESDPWAFKFREAEVEYIRHWMSADAEVGDTRNDAPVWGNR